MMLSSRLASLFASDNGCSGEYTSSTSIICMKAMIAITGIATRRQFFFRRQGLRDEHGHINAVDMVGRTEADASALELVQKLF